MSRRTAKRQSFYADQRQWRRALGMIRRIGSENGDILHEERMRDVTLNGERWECDGKRIDLGEVYFDNYAKAKEL